jgi:hypothetical protein
LEEENVPLLAVCFWIGWVFLKECNPNCFQNFLLQFFPCYLLYFAVFLHSLIFLSLCNFKTLFLNLSLMRISFRISLLNHGLSLFQIVTIFVRIHSFVIFRKHFVSFSHISSSGQVFHSN